MGKFIKKFITALWYVLFSGATLIAVVFGLMLLPGVQRHVSEALESVLHDATGLPVKVGNVKYFPLTTVKISEISIADRDTMPMMVLMSAKADLSLLSLLDRSLTFNIVDVDSLGIFVRRDADGHFNFEVMKPDTAQVSEPSGVSLPLVIKAVRAQNCEIRYEQDGKEHMHLSNLGLDVTDIEAAGGDIRAAVNRFSFDVPDLGKRFDASADFSLKDDTVSIRRLNASLGRGSMLRVDSFALAQDTAGIAFLSLSLQNCQLDKELTSYIAGRPAPSLTLSGDLGVDSLRYFSNSFHAACDDRTEISLSASIDRGWRNNDYAKSRIDIKRLSTTVSSLQEMLGAEPTPKADVALGSIVFKGTLSALGKDLNLRLDGSSMAAQAHIFATAHAHEGWTKADISANATADADLSWLTDSKIGSLSLSIDADGKASEEGIAYAKINCESETAELLGHTYKGIRLSGLYADRHFDALASVDDHLGKVLVLAAADLGRRETPFSLTVKADEVMLGKLGIWSGHEEACFSTKLRLESSGTDPDKAEAYLTVADVSFTDKNDTASLGSLHLSMQTVEGGNRLIALNSDLGNGELKGHFSFSKLVDEILRQAKTASPALFGAAEKVRARGQRQEAELTLELHGIQPFTHVFLPSLSVPEEIRLSGHLDSEDHSGWLSVSTDSIGYSSVGIEGLSLAINNKNGVMTAGASARNMKLPLIGSASDMMATCELSEDDLLADIAWEGVGGIAQGGFINASAAFSKESGQSLLADVQIDKSQLTLLDSLWTLDSCRFLVSDKVATIDNFRMQSGERYVALTGKASTSPDDTLWVSVNKITLEDIIRTDEDSHFSLAGDLYAGAQMRSVLSNVELDCNAFIDKLYVNGDRLDNLSLVSSWTPDADRLSLDLAIVTNGLPRAVADGYYDTKADKLLLDFDIDSLSTGFLNFYLSSSIKDWHGSTSGKLWLHGPLSDIKLDARLKMNDDNVFTVKSTNVSYRLDNQDSVILSPTRMTFKDIRFADRLGKHGVFGGHIDHNMFSSLKMALTFRFGDQLVMQTTEKDSPTYFGTIYARGNMNINGTMDDIRMSINAQTSPNTTFNILPSAKGDVGENSYILFKNNKGGQDDTKIDISDLLSSLTARLDLTITPDAEINVVINPSTDNKLTGRGNGRIQMNIDNNGDLAMFGDYEIETGNYNFSFENIINKQFVINKGGHISWNGDPYDATIDIVATYKLKASLYDLVQGSGEEASSDLKKRVPINCNILLTDRLTNPDIKFDIEIPSSMNFNQYAFDQYVNTEEEMNRQVFSLLLANRFYTAQDASSQSASQSQSYLGTTASELISNQLSSLVSQNKYNVDVGVNYRPGDEVTNEEYEVALSTQLLNNKIVLSGNIGYGRDASGTSQDAEGSIIGDFDIEVKLNKKGNIRAKAYTHSNNDVIYETSPTTQGIGISYQEEFNAFREFIHKVKSLFVRRRKGEEKQPN